MNELTPYPITPIGSFIGVVLALLPLISQIRKFSLAVWGYAIWIAIVNFQMFVNTIIWYKNVDIVVPVWCDIATKLQTGAGVGTRACALVICVHLYKITRIRVSIDTAKKQRRRAVIYELLLIIGLPFLVMALSIIVQPTRFDISEEEGCTSTVYSYVSYIILYAPLFVSNLGCAILAPFTLRTFLRHRKEMSLFLSSSRDITHNKYNRLMVITCLDTIFNLPVDIAVVVMSNLPGKEGSLKYPYINWKNVHDGAGGIAPGLSLSSITQTPASEWSADAWGVLTTKWNEWCFVLHAVVFFGVFGTTPEMRQYYRSAFWFIPERFGYKRRHFSDVETVSDVAFNSNSALPTANRRRGSLSFLETTIDTIPTHSEGILLAMESPSSDLESGPTTAGTQHAIETVEGGRNKVVGGMR